jgi:hypothetical protein
MLELKVAIISRDMYTIYRCLADLIIVDCGRGSVRGPLMSIDSFIEH